MFSRHDLCDDHWDRIRHLLPGQAGGHGGVGDDTRLFVNVIRLGVTQLAAVSPCERESGPVAWAA